MNARRMIPLLLIVATVAVYAPVSRYEFVNYDDPLNVYENPHVTSGLTVANLRWAFSNGVVGVWIPLTWLSLMLDAELYGLQAGGYHLTNLLWHMANAVLLFWLLRKLTSALWPSAWVAAMFAVHPLQVESVVWVTERRDVLSACFWMLTLWTYADYARRPSRSRYLVVCGLYALGLMSKPTLVTLPVVMWLLDWWPLDRWRSEKPIKLVLEKVPLLALAAGASLLSILFQQQIGALVPLSRSPLPGRIGGALLTYLHYLGKTVWPVELAVTYPSPATFPEWQVVLAGLLIAIIVIAVIRLHRLPYLAVGWLWFLGTLVPMIGLVPAGGQSMADHCGYIPLIGLLIAVAWGASSLARPQLLTVVATMALIGCAILASRQLRYWRDSISLFEHALVVTPDNWTAHNGLGIALYQQGKLEEARRHFVAAIQINPGQAALHQNLGNVLAAEGRLPAAIAEYRVALQLKPNDPEIRHALATALYNLAGQEQAEQAIRHLREALRFQPDDPQAHYNLANLLPAAEAVFHFEAALRVRPGHARTHTNLANALLALGRRDEAIMHYREALRLDPQQAEARHNLSVALAGDR